MIIVITMIIAHLALVVWVFHGGAISYAVVPTRLCRYTLPFYSPGYLNPSYACSCVYFLSYVGIPARSFNCRDTLMGILYLGKVAGWKVVVGRHTRKASLNWQLDTESILICEDER